MEVGPAIHAYSAFEKQLRKLCLTEFPCGSGKWRETHVKNLKELKAKDTVDSKYSVTLKDFGAEHEKTETLQEYVSSKHSPWHVDYSWSKEARQLREIAVKSPWLIDDGFISRHFQTLRIVDKDVNEVDNNLLKFSNLEELTLSANKIVTLNSKNLPRSLKVLELCANKISDLSGLCVSPPLLIHLGLGFNKISFIGDYLTGDFWPNLLSLDLSNNNLSDLLDVVRKLGTLPKLRNLILQGNPLSLIAGYRGYTIDSLKKLNILDDIMISADERHHYKGLAKRREYILDEAKVTLEVEYIKGVPVPEEIKNPDDQPEFPVIERKYYVQFMFLQDNSAKAEILELSQDDVGDISPFPQSGRSSVKASHPPSCSSKQQVRFAVQESDAGEVDIQLADTEKNVNFTSEPEVVPSPHPSVSPSGKDKQTIPLSANKNAEEISVTSEDPNDLDVAPIKLGGSTWAEEMELNAAQPVIRDDLLSLRNFFKQGMTFSVVEEMILLYPLRDPSPEACSSPSRKGSRAASKRGNSASAKGSAMSSRGKTPSQKESSPSRKGSASVKGSRSSRMSSASNQTECYPLDECESSLSKRPPSGSKVLCYPNESPDCATPTKKGDKKDKKKDDKKDDKGAKGGKDDKKKGKKKEPEVEMKRMPPTLTTLATWHIPLGEFLEGEYKFESIYTQGGVEVASTVKSLDIKKDPKDKKKPGSSKKKEDPKGKEGKGKDDKKGKGGKAAVLEEEEDDTPPPPLEVKVAVTLNHWRTAYDSLKEEEEKKRLAEEAGEQNS